VGHSLGGAIAVRVAYAEKLRVIGLVVVDVVEGTAIAALPSMTKIVKTRPKVFKSPQDAVNWALKNRWVSNPESAALSIPSQLVRQVPVGMLHEERYVWRTDLLLSEEHWEGWFKGMTAQLISARMPKMIVLAGRDRMRMDTNLTVAQMQGKFQMVFVQESGHCIQEDRPDKMEEVLTRFIKRIRAWGIEYKFNTPKPTKV